MPLLTDLRFGVRMLCKTPGATLTVLLALSLGIGLSAVTFTLIDGAVLTHLPGEGGDRIVRIDRGGEAPTTARDFETWVARQRSFDGLGAVELSTVTVVFEGWSAEPVVGAGVTPSVLPLLSTAPVLGRTLTEVDAASGAPSVALVSHEIWRDRMGSDPRAPGRVIRVNGRPTEVVGVMPEGFGFPWNTSVWIPLTVDLLRDVEVDFAAGEDRLVVGRLREGVALETAADELTGLALERDAARPGASAQDARVRLRNFTDLFGDEGTTGTVAALMLGVALLVLLVACANVASVLLARNVDRAREVAVRTAMGASRSRIVSQLLAEIALLTLGGAAGGAAIAFVGTRWLDALLPSGTPYWIRLEVDGPALLFVALVAIVTALAAGLGPALRASGHDPNDLLKDNARSGTGRDGARVMGRLVGTEMAMSFVLLALAGLFIRSATNLRNADYVFEPERVLLANANVPETTFASRSELVLFIEELIQTIDALPQIAGTAIASAPPGIGSSPRTRVEIDEASSEIVEPRQARQIVVSPGYFRLFDAAPIAGRGFDARDVEGAEAVAIVNQPFVDRHFPRGDALGRRLRLTNGAVPGEWLTVVGVVPDLVAGGAEQQVPEAVYLPFGQRPMSGPVILARTTGDVAALPASMRKAVAALDPDVAIFRTWPLDEAIDAANSSSHWISLIFLVSGGIAVFLAAIGLYGVMAFWVLQRTREIGVRMAVGGQRTDIIRLVLVQAMGYTGLGLGVGALAALPIARVLAFALYGVAPWDPVVFAATAVVLVGVAVTGCLLPALRATGVDPSRALVVD